MVESLCCSPPTIATLLICYTIQNKKLKKFFLNQRPQSGFHEKHTIHFLLSGLRPRYLQIGWQIFSEGKQLDPRPWEGPADEDPSTKSSVKNHRTQKESRVRFITLKIRALDSPRNKRPLSNVQLNITIIEKESNI